LSHISKQSAGDQTKGLSLGYASCKLDVDHKPVGLSYAMYWDT
jgi:hypothetical protein